MGNPLLARKKESTLHLAEIDDRNDFGYIIFEKSGLHFSCTADGKQVLQPVELNELIEHLSDIPDKPMSRQTS